MIYISFFDDATGEFIKQWPNWTGVVPAVGDVVVLHFGDYNDESRPYTVRLRVIDGTKPDFIKIFIKTLTPEGGRESRTMGKPLKR